MSDAEAIADLVGRLDAIADELADLAIDRLKTSLRARPRRVSDGDETGETGSTIDERTITRARRAIEKAAGLLRGAGRGAGYDD